MSWSKSLRCFGAAFWVKHTGYTHYSIQDGKGDIMANVDLCGVAQLLRALLEEEKISEKEAQRILSRIADQTGADIIISF